MLILTRRTGESVTIGGDVVATVPSVNGNQVRFGFRAPRRVQIDREEVYRKLRELIGVSEEQPTGAAMADQDEGPAKSAEGSRS